MHEAMRRERRSEEQKEDREQQDDRVALHQSRVAEAGGGKRLEPRPVTEQFMARVGGVSFVFLACT